MYKYICVNACVLKYVYMCVHSMNMLYFAPSLSPIGHEYSFFFVEFQKKSGINTSYLPNRILKSTK